MNTNRKTLRIVDLRVRRYLIGQRLTASMRLGRVHSIESLAAEHAEFGTSPESTSSPANGCQAAA